MVHMEWDPNYVPKVKLGLHIAQAVLSFVLWCIEIAVFRSKNAEITGNNGWTFAVCFLSIPAWVYLIMTPRWSRTRKFAQPHAMLVVDALFCVIWLSAFATQAAYNSADDCGAGCGLSNAVVGLGVMVFLLFGGSTFISAYSLQYYNFHGTLPGYDARQIRGGGGGGENIDPDKAAFSMAPHDEEAYERVNVDDHEAAGSAYGGPAHGAYGSSSSRYDNGNPYTAGDDDLDRFGGGSNLGRNNALFDSETAYGGGAAELPPSSYGARPTYDSEEPAQFPAGNYDRGR